MRLCLASNSVPGDLFAKLEGIAKAGFDGVEICDADLIGFAGTPAELGDRAKALGLALDVLQPFADFEGLSGTARVQAMARLDQRLEQMAQMGAGTLLVSTSTHAKASADRAAIVADIAELGERAARMGLRAGLMALPWAAHLAREVDALEIIQEVGSESIGLALNSLFSLSEGAQSARLRDIPGERIFHVQLVDAAGNLSGPDSIRGQIGLLPGHGDLNLASFVRVVARSGYDGPWSVSHMGRSGIGLRENMARDAYRSVVSLLDEVTATEPSLPEPLAGLPPRVYPTGFEFIEFAADAATRDDLAKTLAAMRFRKERQHKTKSVELWRQGAINIVINSETKGFAAKAFAEHGGSVCDMGLRVRDADQTVERATVLGAPEFSQPLAAGELDIPAIKGVGGSVVHFIDEKSDLHRVWDIEFDPVPTTQAVQPAGLRRIDHLAQTMAYDEMQSWLSYYTSTFELRKAPAVDVADPSGVVLSQALASPEGEVRLNLNGAGEKQTFAGAFLAGKFGAGVQHIAFLSDDIFETSELLDAAGFERLQITANYYADLKVTFGLTDAFVAQLRAGNILYDRDGSAEFFQIYNVPVLGGFFFEIVQRKGGYQGYGARNAPVRLAAQNQHLNKEHAA